MLPAHRKISGPASTKAKVPTVTVKLGLAVLVPQAFIALADIVREPVVALLSTLTVIVFVPAPDTIVQPGEGIVQE